MKRSEFAQIYLNEQITLNFLQRTNVRIDDRSMRAKEITLTLSLSNIPGISFKF